MAGRRVVGRGRGGVSESSALTLPNSMRFLIVFSFFFCVTEIQRQSHSLLVRVREVCVCLSECDCECVCFCQCERGDSECPSLSLTFYIT